jgi:hypothetical protein
MNGHNRCFQYDKIKSVTEKTDFAKPLLTFWHCWVERWYRSGIIFIVKNWQNIQPSSCYGAKFDPEKKQMVQSSVLLQSDDDGESLAHCL